jgi:hypothetical protein
MKKGVAILRLAFLVVISSVLFAFYAPASYAGAPGAIVSCVFIGTCTGNGECTCTGVLSNATTEQIHAVESESGKETLICKGDIPKADAPDSATICRGSDTGAPPCTLQGFGTGAVSGNKNVTTQDWQEVISASGQISLVCHNLQPTS